MTRAALTLAALVLALGSLLGGAAGYRSSAAHYRQMYLEAQEEARMNRDAFYQLCQAAGWTNQQCEEVTA